MQIIIYVHYMNHDEFITVHQTRNDKFKRLMDLSSALLVSINY